MMAAEHRNNRHDQFENQDHPGKNIEALLELSFEWNSLEGVKQVLKDIKKQPAQVSLFL